MATLHNKKTAHKIGKKLLEKRLIACYNISAIESAYWWKGEIMAENETLMIMKTKEAMIIDIEKFFIEQSGYEVPEIIALKPHQVNGPYDEWINQEVI